VHSPNDLTQALLNLIRGTGVRRGSHQLLLDETDATSLFIELLLEDKFELLRIEEITIEPGERVPAFYLEKGTAHFGWVFWEAFFPGRMRKIFGSVHRNEKGDWTIVLGRKQQVYANLLLKEEMDLQNPSEF
jgi:hypothetical protein